MDHRVLLAEELVKLDLVIPVDHAEPLTQRAVEAEVGALLRAAFDEHRADLHLLPLADLELHQLVSTLVDSRARHNRQVDGPPQVDQVLLRHVRDHARRALVGRPAALLALLLLLIALVVVVVVVGISQDLALGRLEACLILLVVGVEREEVEALLQVELVVQRELVRDLVLSLHQIELRHHARVLRKLAASLRVQLLDHVLHALIDRSLVQDAAQPLECRVEALRRQLGQRGATLEDEARRDLDGVIRRRLEQQSQHLQRDDLMRDLLVDEVRDETRHGVANDLVVALVGAAELVNGPLDQQLADLRHLCVHDRDERRVHVREARRRHLRLEERPHEQRAAADEVLGEEVEDDRLEVGDVHLVHNAVDRLLQRLPCHALVLLRAFVRHARHHLLELPRRHVQPACLAARLVDDARGGLRRHVERVLDRALPRRPRLLVLLVLPRPRRRRRVGAPFPRRRLGSPVARWWISPIARRRALAWRRAPPRRRRA
mmetsp:Transcript_39317/g.108311  ORF Transcript_39317/g.108311 Transcript_39317/m.108311 type:complete len:491 (+) Transcript_39317:621-2093(+)